MLLKNTKDLFIERNLDDDKKDLNLENFIRTVIYTPLENIFRTSREDPGLPN